MERQRPLWKLGKTFQERRSQMSKIFIDENRTDIYLEFYFNTQSEHCSQAPFVLVIPGGGYFFCNKKETSEVAKAFCEKGFNAAVLIYRTGTEDHYPSQLIDAAKAFDLIRREFQPKEIYLCGFSAGGHLAASLATLWDKEESIKAYQAKPDGIILSYSVLTSGEFENKRTFDELCGSDKELREWVNLVDRVDSNCPRAFIWHTLTDEKVPVENAMLFASALRRNNIPFELHIYQEGPHAMSLCDKRTAEIDADLNPHVATWFDLACDWINIGKNV